jgi:predicted lysophospholipase L1 biosynthesis ABC-type transport system permease subunit
VVVAAGAAVGAVVGLISSYVIFVGWETVLAKGDGEESVIPVLIGFAFLIVPVAAVSGAAFAVTLYRRRTS